jgi:hypothetical protein
MGKMPSFPVPAGRKQGAGIQILEMVVDSN